MKYTEGIGRRKRSTARVRIYSGSKPSTVNGKPLEEFFYLPGDAKFVQAPLKTVDLEKERYFTAMVEGGGFTGQKGAVQLGLARAIYAENEALKSDLRKAGLITRDARSVERKKYNQKKARRKNQFSKR